MKARLLYIEPDSPLRGWAQDVYRDSIDCAPVLLMPGSRLGKRPDVRPPSKPSRRRTRPSTPYGCLSRSKHDTFNSATSLDTTFNRSVNQLSITRPNETNYLLDLKPKPVIKPGQSLASLLAKQRQPAFRITTNKVSFYNKRPSLWKQRPLTRGLSRTAVLKTEEEEPALQVTGTNISIRPSRMSLTQGLR